MLHAASSSYKPTVLNRWLTHPLMRGMDIDLPETTVLRASIIREKAFLRKIYTEWYLMLREALPRSSEGPVLEIGSGAGFLKQYIADAVTSECFYVPTVDSILDARYLPIRTGSLRAIVLTNVLHHIPEPAQFMREAARCVRPGGVIAMIEPWVTPWSTLMYRHLHHEPFDPRAEDWRLPEGGPLSAANDAMPWIIFSRDRKRFDQEFPEWRVREITPFMPFRYLVSGGVSMRSLMWKRTFSLWKLLEGMLEPYMHSLAMFAKIVLQRADAGSPPQSLT